MEVGEGVGDASDASIRTEGERQAHLAHPRNKVGPPEAFAMHLWQDFAVKEREPRHRRLIEADGASPESWRGWRWYPTGERMNRLVFEWDPDKAASNLQKHGVAFEEALTVFMDPLARIHDDPEHSEAEFREIIVGHSTQRRLLVVGYAEGRDAVRIINARPASRKERRDYEEDFIS